MSHTAVLQVDLGREGKQSFFEKKDQKTLVCPLRLVAWPVTNADAASGEKFFCFFFSKKEGLAFFQPASSPCVPEIQHQPIML